MVVRQPIFIVCYLRWVEDIQSQRYQDLPIQSGSAGLAALVRRYYHVLLSSGSTGACSRSPEVLELAVS